LKILNVAFHLHVFFPTMAAQISLSLLTPLKDNEAIEYFESSNLNSSSRERRKDKWLQN